MLELDFLAVWLVAAGRRLRGSAADQERGDVPGWVMVTVMTAGLVVAIFAVFQGEITTALKGAIDNVTGATKG
jgi:hypothetical protein